MLAYVTVFSPDSWLIWSIILLLTCFSCYAAITRKYSRSLHDQLVSSAGVSVAFVYNSVLKLDILFEPHSSSRKVFLMTTSIFSIVMMAHYEAMITSFMTQKSHMPKLNSFADTIDLGYQVIVERNTYHFSRLKTAPVGSGMHRVYNHMKDKPEVFFTTDDDVIKAAMLKNSHYALAAAEYRFAGDARFLPLTHLSDTFEDHVSFAYQVLFL